MSARMSVTLVLFALLMLGFVRIWIDISRHVREREEVGKFTEAFGKYMHSGGDYLETCGYLIERSNRVQELLGPLGVMAQFVAAFRAGGSGLSPAAALASQTASAGTFDETDRDYNYRVAPQALAHMRAIAGRRAALDFTARQYFISGVGGFDPGERDRFFVGDTSLALRLFNGTRLRSRISLPNAAARICSRCPTTRTRDRRLASFIRFWAPAALGAVR